MLNELDKELERRGHRFVRYADDLMIFCKSRRSAHRVLNNILPFIEKKLFLKVNKEKTVVDYELANPSHNIFTTLIIVHIFFSR